MKSVEPIHQILSISQADLQDIWRWLLVRQGVGPDRKFDSIEEISDRTLGLHAARLSSPFVTAMVRASSFEVARAVFEADKYNLTTVRCMRKTLHTLPLPLAAMAHSATLHFRMRDAHRHAFNAQVSQRQLAAVVRDVCALLVRESSLTHREIESLLTHRHSIPVIRIGLKVAWEQGLCTYRNRSGGWNKEHRTFALTDTLHPTMDVAMDRDQATAELMYHYFDRYGPATLRDVMWWSGLSRNTVVDAMNRASPTWVSLDSTWARNPLYMLPERLADFYKERHSLPQCTNFLAHEDVAMKAYFETRSRYLGDMPAAKIFNQIGEILPSIIHDGQVVGKWGWDIRQKRIASEIFSDQAKRVHAPTLTLLQNTYTHALHAALVA